MWSRCVRLSGIHRHDIGGQLAVMDAMVFFAVCSVICATMMSCAMSRTDATDEATPSADLAEGLLATYLEASFGRRASAEPSGLELIGTERFCDVLRVVLVLVVEGHSTEEFSAILAHCEETLSSMCSPWSWSLRLSSSSTLGWHAVTALGELVNEGADAWSASKELGEFQGSTLRATLVLASDIALRGC